MTKEETLARLAESRRALHQAIEGLSEEQITQVQVEGVWTIKDVLGHITSWEETCLEPLRRYADGGPFEVKVIEDYLAWNDGQPPANETSRCLYRIVVNAILDELATIRHGMVAAASTSSNGGGAVGAEGALLVGRRRDDGGGAGVAPRA